MELIAPPLELELAMSLALANGPLASVIQQRLGKVLGSRGLSSVAALGSPLSCEQAQASLLEGKRSHEEH